MLRPGLLIMPVKLSKKHIWNLFKLTAIAFYALANSLAESRNLTGFTVSQRSNLTSDIWSTARIPVQNLSASEYTQLSASLVPDVTAPNSNNTFAVTMNASEVAGTTFYFNLISLFGATYNNRPNGLRADLAQHIKDLNPKFLRFPGGNNIEGYSIETRWKWNNTIGPLTERPGRPGNWEYYNTDGLGLLEYLEWTEDLGLEPVLAVYAGYSLAISGEEVCAPSTSFRRSPLIYPGYLVP